MSALTSPHLGRIRLVSATYDATRQVPSNRVVQLNTSAFTPPTPTASLQNNLSLMGVS